MKGSCHRHVTSTESVSLKAIRRESARHFLPSNDRELTTIGRESATEETLPVSLRSFPTWLPGQEKLKTLSREGKKRKKKLGRLLFNASSRGAFSRIPG